MARPTEQQIDEAKRILRADYWHDIDDIIDDLMSEIKVKEVTDYDAAIEYLDQSIDGHQRCIYTGQAMDTLLWSDNHNAHLDDFGPDYVADTDGIKWEAMAYSALRADVLETLRRKGIDLTDRSLYRAEEDDESDTSPDQALDPTADG
jgi:uncharacterized protein YheU (UPF0270 family)